MTEQFNQKTQRRTKKVTKKPARSYGKGIKIRISPEIEKKINRAKGAELLKTGNNLSNQEFICDLIIEGLKKFEL